MRVASAAALLAAMAAPLAAQQADTAPPPQSVTLVREVFAYEGGGRDPFMSLLRSGDVRPLLFSRLNGLFLKLNPCPWTNFHIVR